jgi:hypothetical protein
MEHTIRVRALGVAITLGLAAAISLITSAAVASRAYRDRAVQSAKNQQELTVKGSARTRVRSDLAIWRIEVGGDGNTLKDAYAVLEFGIDRVQSFLRDNQFQDSEIGLAAISTQPHLARDKEGKETDQIGSYSLNRVFIVTTADVDRVNHAAGEVTQLLKENVRVVSHAPDYVYTKLADLKVQILGDASKDARGRADQIASNAGCQVADVRRAQMGVIQITQPSSTDVSGYGMYDTSTIDKDISVVVTVTFGIEGS